MTQENESWDDTSEKNSSIAEEKPDSTTTKDSAEMEAPDGVVAPVEADSPATVEPPAPVFDPKAPHATHVSSHGHRLLQNGSLFSFLGKVFIGRVEE